MDRSAVLKLWDDSWTVGSGVAPWGKAVADLTPEQAAWRPGAGGVGGTGGAGRHSIWQIVNHVCIWREYVLAKCGRHAHLPRKEVSARNFEEPGATTAEAWRSTTERLRRTHDGMRDLVLVPEVQVENIVSHFGHDCYHLGQIMYLRAMQGMGPIE